jgi:hypothetical protein
MAAYEKCATLSHFVPDAMTLRLRRIIGWLRKLG